MRHGIGHAWMTLVPVVTAAMLAAGTLSARADTLQVTVNAITTSADRFDTTPRLGNDGLSPDLVYARQDIVGHTLLPGNIYYQRLSSGGVPIGPELPVSTDTDGSTDDQLTDSSGSLIVYTALNPATYTGFVRLYDAVTGVTTDLIPAADTVQEARIDGDIVAWVQGEGSHSRIEMVDLTWPVLSSITLSGDPHHGAATGVEVGSRYVVWQQSNLDTGHLDIMAYDLWSGSRLTVAASPSKDESQPATFGDLVVWQERDLAHTSLWGRNLSTSGAPFVIADPGATVQHPSIDGDLVGYESRISGNFDVYLYRISDGTTYQVTNTPDDEILNDVFGNLVAFVHKTPTEAGISVASLNFVHDVVPGADAGADRTVNESQALTLDGTHSHDPLGQGLTYQWVQVAPTGINVTLSGADTATPTFTAPGVDVNTVFTFQLIVTDAAGRSSSPDTVDVMVLDADLPPVADAGADAQVREGGAKTLDGSGSFDPEGLALTYTWTQTGGPAVSLDLTNPARPTFTAPLAGMGTMLAFRLDVADPGRKTASDTVAITVSANNAPVANAGTDQTVNEGALVRLEGGRSSDPDGDGLLYSWAQVAGPGVGLDFTDHVRPTFVAPVVAPGGAAAVFRLVVADDFAPDPLVSTSDEVSVHIQHPNDPPRCDGARPSPDVLWPPNHTMTRVAIRGLTDPDGGGAIAITVTGVTSDEPARGPGDPHSPDAIALCDGSVLLRAERAGSGNGRVYAVHFTASDGIDSCSGTVRVGVPPNRHETAVGDAQVYDATQGQ